MAKAHVSLAARPGGVAGSIPRMGDLSAAAAAASGGGKDDMTGQESSIEAKKAKKSKFGLKMPSTLKRGKLSEVSSGRRFCC